MTTFCVDPRAQEPGDGTNWHRAFKEFPEEMQAGDHFYYCGGPYIDQALVGGRTGGPVLRIEKATPHNAGGKIEGASDWSLEHSAMFDGGLSMSLRNAVFVGGEKQHTWPGLLAKEPPKLETYMSSPASHYRSRTLTMTACEGLRILGVEFTQAGINQGPRMHDVWYFIDCHDVGFTGCSAGKTNRAIGVAIGRCSNLWFEDNIFHDRDCDTPSVHGEGFQIFPLGEAGLVGEQGARFHHNLFRDVIGTGFIILKGRHTAMVEVTDNVFVHEAYGHGSNGTFGNSSNDSSLLSLFARNLVFNCKGQTGVCFHGSENAARNDVMANIWAECIDNHGGPVVKPYFKGCRVFDSNIYSGLAVILNNPRERDFWPRTQFDPIEQVGPLPFMGSVPPDVPPQISPFNLGRAIAMARTALLSIEGVSTKAIAARAKSDETLQYLIDLKESQ